MKLIDSLKPLVSRIGTLSGHFTRSMTLGVRVVARDGEGRVILVRHTYLPGWYLPGGGVDPGEVLHVAAARELREEAGYVVTSPPRLIGMYLNARVSRRDHVGLFVADGVTEPAVARRPDHEIAEIGRFDPDALPDDLSPATVRRLDEVLRGVPAVEIW